MSWLFPVSPLFSCTTGLMESDVSALLQVSEAGREQKVKAQDGCEEEDAQSRVQRGKTAASLALTGFYLSFS